MWLRRGLKFLMEFLSEVHSGQRDIHGALSELLWVPTGPFTFLKVWEFEKTKAVKVFGNRPGSFKVFNVGITYINSDVILPAFTSTDLSTYIDLR